MAYRRRKLQSKSRLESNMRMAAAAGKAVYDGYRVAKSASGLYRDIVGTSKRQKTSGEESTSTSSTARTVRLDPQVQQDYRRSVIRYGKKKRTGFTARKLTRTQMNKTVFTVRNYGAWNRGLGAIDIRSNQPTLASPVECPVHLWELTGAVQATGNRTNVDYPATFYKLEFDGTGSSHTANFTTIVGGTTLNVNGFDVHSSVDQKDYSLYPTWSDQRKYATPGTLSNNAMFGVGAKSYLESFKAKFVLNGPQQRPTRWCIQLVQLKETVTPGWAGSNDTVATAFWEAISKPYGFSTLDPGPAPHLRKYMKVLKTMYVTMDAPESSEDHLICRMRHVDFTGFLNRKCNYAWGQNDDLTNLASDDIPENAFADTGTEFSTHVHPNARIYIMVRALCTLRIDELPSNAYYPSYDLLLQTTHRSLD